MQSYQEVNASFEDLPIELVIEIALQAKFHAAMALILVCKKFAAQKATVLREQGRRLFGNSFVDNDKPENDKYNNAGFWQQRFVEQFSHNLHSKRDKKTTQFIRQVMVAIVDNDLDYLQCAVKNNETLFEDFMRKHWEHYICHIGSDTLLFHAAEAIQEYFYENIVVPFIKYDNQKHTALHFSIICKRQNLLEQLCSNTKMTNEPNRQGYTPLHLACLLGAEDAVKYLIQLEHIDVSIRVNVIETALHLAARNGHFAIVNGLLSLPQIDSSSLYWAYIDAAQYGHLAIMQRIEQYLGFIIPNIALNYACAGRSMPVMEYLLEKGLDANFDCLGHIDVTKSTALINAVRGGQEQMVLRLLKINNLNINFSRLQSRDTALIEAVYCAIRNGKFVILDALLADTRTEVNWIIGYDVSAISKAVSLIIGQHRDNDVQIENVLQVIQRLLDKGANGKNLFA